MAMTLLDALYIPLAVVTAPLWAFKKRAGWREKFGSVAGLPEKPATGSVARKPRILVHAVSVGEVSALRGLVPLLLPHAEVVISVTTDTGTARAKDLFAKDCAIVRYPLDFSWSVRRFLDAIKPDAVALVELEVWPQFVRACAARQVPTCIINGRLSERSFKGYRRVRGFFGGVLRNLAFAAVQDRAYGERFEVLGLPADKVLLTGTMKWDAVRVPEVEPPVTASVRESVAALVSTMKTRMQREGAGGDAVAMAPVVVSPARDRRVPLPRVEVAGSEDLARELGIDRSKPLVVAGSTAEDEEALLVASVPAGVQLLCAPRKPEHFEDAARAMGPGVIRRTQRPAGVGGGAAGASAGGGSGMFLLDTIGELRKAYALADVVVMGRSFGTQHGSDPIEPIALGKPTLIGPRFGDFQAIVEALTAPGANSAASAAIPHIPSATGLRVVSRAQLAGVLAELIGDAALREAMVRAGWACVRAHQGASARHAELLLALAVTRTRQFDV
jgi:3-deoxy-D-manno-octulosonic-acid transferase